MNQTDGAAVGLYAELRRRRVFRTLALYIVGAWGLMQVADVVLPGLGLAEENIRYLLIAAVAGFPVALIFGWFFDVTATGIHRTRALAAGETTEPEPLRAVDYGLLAALLAILGLILYGVLSGVAEIDLADKAASPAPRAERTEGPPMVGVLPFAHMGTSEEGDFFASGIHDDLLTRLAKIQSLRVISRTSVLQYADTTKAIPEIGGELGADAILEGGVRIAGNQIRINAQLIDARTDEHLWAETFDRELTAANIFAVQSEIARAISNAMAAALSPEDESELALIPTSNMAAYRAFHEIMQWRDTVHLSDENRSKFVAGLEKAFELDPNFTRPMVEVVGALALDNYYENSEDQSKEAIRYIEGLIDRIGRIAPDSADYYTAQGLYVYYILRDFDRAEALLEKAQARAPSDTRLIDIQSWIQRRKGDFEGALESARKVVALEPTNDRAKALLAGRLAGMYRFDEALALAEEIERPGLMLAPVLAKLRFNEHRDLARLEEDMTALLQDGLSPSRRGQILGEIWEVQIARRNFAAAEETSEAMGAVDEGAEPPLDFLPPRVRYRVANALLRGDLASASAMVPELKRWLTTVDEESLEGNERVFILDRALVMIAAGDNARAVPLLNRVWQDPTMDRTLWYANRGYACDMLALAGAAAEATACLRNALSPPSRVLPFFQPHLPFYDGIRDAPVFQEYMDELAAEGWLALAGE